MPPPPTYDPTPDQLTMLVLLTTAPFYLIIRDRPWLPVRSIVPIRSQAGLDHLTRDLDRAGRHVQLVSYRPDEEDLGPMEPNPWPLRLMEIALAILIMAAIWLLTRVPR